MVHCGNPEDDFCIPHTNVCTEDDVKYNRGGCNAIGQYPDKDKSASSLITPPSSKADAFIYLWLFYRKQRRGKECQLIAVF